MTFPYETDVNQARTRENREKKNENFMLKSSAMQHTAFHRSRRLYDVCCFMLKRKMRESFWIYIPEHADHGVVDALKHVAFTGFLIM